MDEETHLSVSVRYDNVNKAWREYELGNGTYLTELDNVMSSPGGFVCHPSPETVQMFKEAFARGKTTEKPINTVNLDNAWQHDSPHLEMTAGTVSGQPDRLVQSLDEIDAMLKRSAIAYDQQQDTPVIEWVYSRIPRYIIDDLCASDPGYVKPSADRR